MIKELKGMTDCRHRSINTLAYTSFSLASWINFEPGTVTCSTVLNEVFKMFIMDSTIIRGGSENVTSVGEKKYKLMEVTDSMILKKVKQ